MVKKVLYFLLFIFLSVLTQVGGIVLLLSLLASNWLKTKFKFKTLLIFVLLYVATTFLLVPHVAPKFGRSKIANLRPTNFVTVLLNRNYINSEYRNTLRRLNGNLRNQGVELHFLDANFPFIDGFPLLPSFLVVQIQRGSTSMIQRKFKLSYVRAGRKKNASDVNNIINLQD